MRRIALICGIIFFMLPIVKIFSQELAQSTGAYNELVQAYTYSVQGKEISKEEEEKILKSLSNEMRAKLEEIKKLDKNKYFQLLRTRFPRGVGNFGADNKVVEVYGLAYAGEREKKEKELEVDVELLAIKYKNAESSSKTKLKSDLTAKLSELFEIREGQKENEVKKLEKRLQELKESLQARKQNKEEIVQRRIQELLGDSRYLRWE